MPNQVSIWFSQLQCLGDFRRHHRIKFGSGRQNADVLAGQQAAQYLGISRNGLSGLSCVGAVHKRQLTDFAPWRISKAELDSERVQRVVRALKATGRILRDFVDCDDQLAIFPDKPSQAGGGPGTRARIPR